MKFETGRASMPTVMNMIPPKAVAVTVAAFISIFLLFQIVYRSPPVSSSTGGRWWHKSDSTDDILAPIQNETLGVSRAESDIGSDHDELLLTNCFAVREDPRA